jgi:hypothetical protein
VRRAQLDPALAVRIIGVRELRYSSASADLDRPDHVRAASGLAVVGNRLAIIQDDVAFIALVAGDEVSAVPLPRGRDGRRRFEVGLGNKGQKLDLEACIVVDDQLWAFGSGSTAARERLAVVDRSGTRLHDGAPLYAALRVALSGVVNIEGVAAVGDELWLFHRGNTGPTDAGPAIVRFELRAFVRWLTAAAPVPDVAACERYDLGAVGGVPLGFTDATCAHGSVYYLAAAEVAANAIDDGPMLAARLGVIDRATVRQVTLPIGKAEGIAFDPEDRRRVWIVCDPDDVDRATRLYDVRLEGPW